MIETIYFDARHHVVGAKQQASFRLDIIRNPDEHEEAATKRQWKDTAVTVRKSNFKMCQGSISIDFFHGETVEDTSIVFLLYFMARTRTGQHAELVGFALCDEEDDDDDEDVDTLYINALCANPDVRYVPEGGIKGLGSILMKQIEYFARDEGSYDSIRLSALGYVINYYRRFGFRHVSSCDELRKDRRKTGNETWVEKDKDIRKAAEANMKHRFAKESHLEESVMVELAKEKKIHATGKNADRIRMDYLLANLNFYFRSADVKFIDMAGRIIAIKDNDTIDKRLSDLVYQDNSSVLKLVNVLRRKGFSVECDEETGRSTRHNYRLDEDGDPDFHCSDEGYTMRKCLDKWPDAGAADRPVRDEDNTRSTSGGSKKNNKRVYKMAYGKRSRGRRTRKRVPWAGWSKIEPRGHKRTVMKRDCGKKCFLGPDKSFPICAKDTCRVNDKGLWAAYIRAKEWGKPRKSYKGKARPRHTRRVYSRVANRARSMLKRRGYYVGKGGSTCKSAGVATGASSVGGRRSRHRRTKKCPKGKHHKIMGQRRNRRGRITRHGHVSKKCYRK